MCIGLLKGSPYGEWKMLIHTYRTHILKCMYYVYRAAERIAVWQVEEHGTKDARACCERGLSPKHRWHYFWDFLRRLVAQVCVVCCSVLQCVVVCCSVLQCVAVCCGVLQWVLQSVLQSVLQCVLWKRLSLTHPTTIGGAGACVAVCCSVLRSVCCRVYCSVFCGRGLLLKHPRHCFRDLLRRMVAHTVAGVCVLQCEAVCVVKSAAECVAVYPSVQEDVHCNIPGIHSL